MTRRAPARCTAFVRGSVGSTQWRCSRRRPRGRAALDGEPVDEVGVGLVVEAAQHRAPGGELERERAAVEPRASALDPAALAGVERLGLGSRARSAATAPRRRTGSSGSSRQRGELVGRLGQARDRAAARRTPGRSRWSRPRRAPDLLAHGGEEAPRRGPATSPCGQPRPPVGRGQALARRSSRRRRACCASASSPSRSVSALSSPRARLPRRALGAAHPAAQLGGLDAARARGERAVGRVEQVVALVEDVAQRARRVVVEAAHRAAWIMTSAWLAIDDVGRARRGGSPSRRSRCGSAGRPEWMHSPRRSARRCRRWRAEQVGSQAGKSPPVMSPSRLARAQRASRPRPTAFCRQQARRCTASWKFSRQR